MTIRISLGTVLIAIALVAIGAGTAVGVMLWEPWDGDGEVVDTPSLQPTDVFDLFITACLGELANEIVIAAVPLGANNSPMNQRWRDWVKFTFEYEADGWWRVRPDAGIFWRIHEVTAEVKPSC